MKPRNSANGLNCALGAALMRPDIQELARVAGLPNPISNTGFDVTPEVTSHLLRQFADEGLVNIVGGCCGTTPEHIQAIAKAVAPLPTRGVSSGFFYRDAA